MASHIDTLFVGGSVFTTLQSVPEPLGVAVASGQIVAVGPDASLRAAASADTDIVDLAGGLVLPGFGDSHVHPVMAGISMLQCELHDLRSTEETLAAIKAYVHDNPSIEWVVGAGWSMEFFSGGTPTRQLLDDIVADRPVYLTNRDGHGAWVNTEALRRAGLNENTPDPVDGRIEREPDNFPAGTLHEGAALLVGRLVPDVTASLALAGLLKAQEVMFANGITQWQDAAIGSMFGMPDNLPVYLTAATNHALKARVRGALWWDRERDASQIAELVERRDAGRLGRFFAGSIKIMQDGVAENFTAGMTEPYLDGCGCPTANAGLSFVDPQQLRDYVTQLDALDFQVHFHALGDRAVREALDALEVARDVNGSSDHRHHLAHLQVVHPDDIPRFAQIGATANMQPLWACHEPQMDELTLPFLGQPRDSWQYPFGDLLRSGAHLAAGSDWPVSSPNPIWGTHVAVNRQIPKAEGEVREPFFPKNALSLADSLTAYTAGTARVNHLDDTGRVAVGLRADLVVLDRNPFEYPASEIASTSVRETFVDGERVFRADA